MSYKLAGRFFSTWRICVLVFAGLLLSQLLVHGQPGGNIGKLPVRDSSKAVHDTTAGRKDTTIKRTDTLNVSESSSAFKSEVKYKAKDSIIYDLGQKRVYLYGNAHIDYEDISLDADSIAIDYTNNTIYAGGMRDSTGKLKGTPKFKQGGEEIRSQKMAYNFRSKKGKISEFRTQQGDGYIQGDTVKTTKLQGKDAIYVKHARYTTCNLETPHFYMSADKLKILPKDKVITGPAFMVVEGVTIPVPIPFGFFPANNEKSSGLIIPNLGQSATQGFALTNGGFYYGGSDHYDAALTGDIYTNGSYRLDVRSSYAQRYQYGGNFNIDYARNQLGLRETPQFTVQENYALHWTHHQDPKANPTTNFSSDVNIATSDFLKRNSYDINQIANQSLSSSISYSKRFSNSPFNFSAALRHAQNLTSGTTDLTLPDMSFGMSQIKPFKSKNAIKKKWYDDINVSYNLNMKNVLNTTDSTIKTDFKSLDRYKIGAAQSLPVSTNFKVFRYFTLTPSVNDNTFFYTKREDLQWVDRRDSIGKDRGRLVSTVKDGFYMANIYTINTNISTIVYGMYNINHGNLVAFRHVLTPTIGVTYQPDFSNPNYGYYGSVQADSTGRTKRYSHYAVNTIIGGPPQGRVGALTYNLLNNFELKVKTKPKENDTSNTPATKKIKILENLNFSGNYNFLADSMKLSPVGVLARTTLYNKFNIQASGTYNPYYVDPHGGLHKEFDWNRTGRWGRFSDANAQFGFTLNEKPVHANDRIIPVRNPFLSYYYPQPYANFAIPWNLTFYYTVSYNGLNTVTNPADQLPYLHPKATSTVQFSGDFNLTTKWKIVYQTGYDMSAKQITTSKITIYRDLHCWTMQFDWIPFGTYRSYFFNIHIKAASLKDLKFDKRKEYYDFNQTSF
jgi:lipopolysaccharide assembly outer membrane protein LptD (OstA)